MRLPLHTETAQVQHVIPSTVRKQCQTATVWQCCQSSAVCWVCGGVCCWLGLEKFVSCAEVLPALGRLVTARLQQVVCVNS